MKSYLNDMNIVNMNIIDKNVVKVLVVNFKNL